MLCASGYLTGTFGIWDDPSEGLDEPARLAWVVQQLVPLLPFVRKQWIEVRYVTNDPRWRYEVIPLERLVEAFADPMVRHQGDEWGIGLNCVFTDIGYSVWLGAWSQTWGSRLRFD